MNLNHAAQTVLNLIFAIINLVFGVFAAIELWLRTQLAHLGVTGDPATIILVLIAIAFFVGALRLFGGALQILLFVFLILFALQLLFSIAPVSH